MLGDVLVIQVQRFKILAGAIDFASLLRKLQLRLSIGSKKPICRKYIPKKAQARMSTVIPFLRDTNVLC